MKLFTIHQLKYKNIKKEKNKYKLSTLNNYIFNKLTQDKFIKDLTFVGYILAGY